MPRKGGTGDRGYGWKHQQERAKWATKVKRGTVQCWRCLEQGRPPHEARIHPNEPWDLGHDDHDRNQYRGPEHIRCNRATAGRRQPPAALDFFTTTRPNDAPTDTLGA